MVNGPRKHLKRLNAPNSWILDKLGGTFAPRPRCGPHKLRECLPLCLIVRRKLSFAQNTKEVLHILNDRLVKVDGKVRKDPKYPAGVMDVVSFDKIHENYRLLYNVNKKFCLQPITKEEAKFKLCKVLSKRLEGRSILTLHTNDGRTIKYADPSIKIGDSIKFDLESGEVQGFYSLEVGKTAYAFRGKNLGCVGIIREIKVHISGFSISILEDLNGRMYTTRTDNLMVIGNAGESLITLPKERGIRTNAMMDSNMVYGEFKEEEDFEEENSVEESDEE
ncbi:small subunit ribosomal protein S4e [Nematocida parisii]|uniref:40S ribosomal protein S4 n=1 Tax=Nematocida parisii (strain ERTm3) TaxID=935791 RepID=I3EIQ3_NEMP3|nr:ribosomal protein S4 [Nematocida parisii ERTm1]EIJ89100.1 ribosomal protein S4 [Nematocida parisii ERTm3]KAI5125917.1 small subunit ribosomal protein S4e [Nematocida parisii]KAI5183628.1 small subunit ribosomal protein S4e [Nematocida sp. AWRm78]OAG33511.1 small subunit ribosomal protein S4e [Nematocida sp. ERTm5]EIJ93346.1 ribosomal protein S4 [Nematocida parisii ERTm1]|eukprot:XP_013059516.1 ribosomal protein S4 [Nematocida parisii ERTm1]